MRLRQQNPRVTLLTMQLDELLTPWIQQLETAFEPYPPFVEQVSQSLLELEQHQSELVIALAQANSESVRLGQLLADQAALKHVGDTDDEAETQLKFQSFVVEIASLKSQIQSQGSELQAKQVQLETLKVQLEEQSSARKQVQAKLEEDRRQIETLKVALNEAKHSSAHPVDERASTPRVSQAKAPALPERKVLLVDDAEINRVLMSHYFKGLPVKLHFAISVSAALQKFKEHQFDLVVVDDELQGLDGKELVQGAQKLVALSNRTEESSSRPEFLHVLHRGQSREAFVDQLKSFLWSA